MSKAFDLASELEAALGANDEQQEVDIWLDTGFPPLNEAISGDYRNGMPVGRIVEMFGGSSCGKTAIATSVMAAAQRMGGIACFMDHEHSFDVGLAADIGLDPTPGRWVYKAPDTFEASIDMAVKLGKTVRGKKLIPDDAPIVVVFDSLASMVPQSKLFDAKGEERDSESYNMHDNTALARCTAASFPALNLQASKLNMLLLFLNQIRTKPGVAYGDPTTTPGGNAPEFYSSVRISLTRAMLKDKDKEVAGQDISAYIKKNKVSRPFQRAKWRFLFKEDGSGKFDAVYSTLEHMKDIGLLKAAGARVEFEGKSYYLSQLSEQIEKDGRLNDLVQMLVDHKAAILAAA